jgi:hypothetical protein
MNQGGGAAQQEVSQRITREGTVEGELPKSPVSIDPILLDSLQYPTELDLVLAAEPTQVPASFVGFAESKASLCWKSIRSARDVYLRRTRTRAWRERPLRAKIRQRFVSVGEFIIEKPSKTESGIEQKLRGKGVRVGCGEILPAVAGHIPSVTINIAPSKWIGRGRV